MPTIGHVAVGLAGSKLRANGRERLRVALVFTALSTFQDVDILLPSSWGGGWVHRGALHSPAAALAAAAIGVLLLWDLGGRARTFLFALAVAVSHGLLDILSRGGVGVMLLWPLSLVRVDSPWQPLPPSPFAAHYLSPRFLLRLIQETLLFSPLLVWACWPRGPAVRAPVSGPSDAENP